MRLQRFRLLQTLFILAAKWILNWLLNKLFMMRLSIFIIIIAALMPFTVFSEKKCDHIALPDYFKIAGLTDQSYSHTLYCFVSDTGRRQRQCTGDVVAERVEAPATNTAGAPADNVGQNEVVPVRQPEPARNTDTATTNKK
jgi:hypothetical protein